MAEIVTHDESVGIRSEELFVNMGPQHPSTHGVLRVLTRLDGEKVLDAQADVGYLHRCFEKIAEKRQLFQVIPYTDRTDYLAAIHDELVFVMAVEKLIEVEVPARGTVHPFHHVRAPAARESPIVVRHVRHGPRRDDCLLVRVA